jgi:hypothetical protein
MAAISLMVTSDERNFSQSWSVNQQLRLELIHEFVAAGELCGRHQQLGVSSFPSHLSPQAK